MNLTELFHSKKEPVIVKEELSDSDKYLIKTNPCLANPEVMEAFKLFVYYSGHCPLCNDILFPEISVDENGVYTLIKKCMDRNCDYTLDVSEDFNNQLGIIMPKKDLDLEQEDIDKEYSLNGLSDDLIERQAKLNIKRGHIPYAYYNLPDDVTFNLQQKQLDILVEWIGECPVCAGEEFEITTENNISMNRMEAEARCIICNSVFDVSDFYAFAAYGEFPDILEQEYDIRWLSDCEMRFLGKANVPSCTGTLKKSF